MMKTVWMLMLAVLLTLVFVGVGSRVAAVRAEDQVVRDVDADESVEESTDTAAELQDLHAESRGRIADADDELADLEAEAPAETPAAKAFDQARRQLLQKRSALDRAILAIDDMAQLERAWELVAQVEELDVEWDLVLQPGLHSALTMEEMQTQLKQKADPQQRELVKKLKTLQEEDARARKQEFELLKARQTRAAAMDALIDEFWKDQ